MELFGLTTPEVQKFFIVFIRLATILLVIPFYGEYGVPIQLKLGLALLLAVLITPLVGAENGNLMIESLWGFTLAVVQGILAGLLIGFVPLLLFAGVQLGGEISGFQMGFGIVNVMDPLSESSISLIAQFDYIISILIFITMNGHLYLLDGVVKSFQVLPLMGGSIPQLLGNSLIRLSSEMFIIGLKIAAPILVAIMLTNVGLGILARTMPQMNIFIVGFPVQIGIGLITLGMSIPVFVHIFEKAFFKFYQEWLAVIKAL